MAHIRIYTTTYCPYCIRAKQLLDRKGLSYQEMDVTDNEKLRMELIALAQGRTTVPQIFFDDQLIGGCDDLYALDASGNLDRLIQEMGLKVDIHPTV